MAKFRVGYLLVAVVLGSRQISALPRAVVAPNESMYGERDGVSGCAPLTLDQAKGLPGWPQIVEYAKNTYGDDGLTYVLNPEKHLDGPATVCVDQKPISVSLNDKPSCSTTQSTIKSTLSGSTGHAELSYSSGFTNTGSWNVTQESSLATGISLSASVSIPPFESLSTAVTTTATFRNTAGNGFTTAVNAQTMLMADMGSPDGKTCTGALTTTACSASGTGTVQYVAGGWVWFYYNTPRAPKSDPKGTAKHYEWAIRIESVIKNVNDRSSSLKFQGTMQMKLDSDFKGSCS